LRAIIYHFVADNLAGFKKWIKLGDTNDTINVAVFDDYGLSISPGFHTLSTTTPLVNDSYYNAFVFNHGPNNTHTSHAYLAGYDCKYDRTYEIVVMSCA